MKKSVLKALVVLVVLMAVVSITGCAMGTGLKNGTYENKIGMTPITVDGSTVTVGSFECKAKASGDKITLSADGADLYTLTKISETEFKWDDSGLTYTWKSE